MNDDVISIKINNDKRLRKKQDTGIENRCSCVMCLLITCRRTGTSTYCAVFLLLNKRQYKAKVCGGNRNHNVITASLFYACNFATDQGEWGLHRIEFMSTTGRYSIIY